MQSLSRESQHSRSTHQLAVDNKQLKELVETLKMDKMAYHERLTQLELENKRLKQGLKEAETYKTEAESLQVECAYNKELISHFQGMILNLNSVIDELKKNHQSTVHH